VSNKYAIRDAFLSSQRAQDSTKITQSDLRNEKETRDDLKSNAIKRNVENYTRYKREATKEKDNSELDEIEDRETKKALQWLGVE